MGLYKAKENKYSFGEEWIEFGVFFSVSSL